MSVEVLKQVWPEWIVEKRIGGGSYGEVYEATRSDYSTGEKAAIKIIPIPQNEFVIWELRSEGNDDQSIKDYFSAVANECLDEIRAMISLEECPNVVNIKNYTVVEQEDGIGRYILILMELLVPFAEYECDKVLSENDVIKLGCDICTALEACAEENILHRDIKQSNILVTKRGDFKLTDFGIARKLDNRASTLTKSTGTPDYIAPEVAKSTTYDARADLYSLGLVLYRLLNKKRLPFLPVERQLLTLHDKENAYHRRVDNGEKLPPPCDASPLMAEVILRACAYDPKDRFSSATEMKQALMRGTSGLGNNSSNSPESCKGYKQEGGFPESHQVSLGGGRHNIMTHFVDRSENLQHFSVEELWEKIVTEMFSVYSRSISMWFDLCKPILLTKHSLIVSADNDFVKMNISDRFQEELDKAATKIMGRPFTVHVVVSISE